MKRAVLARQLAVSLSLGAWSMQSVEAVLRRRLPAPLGRIAAPLAASLIAWLPAQYAPRSKVIAQALLDEPLFETVWRFCRRADVWPDPDLTTPRMAPIDALAQLDVPQLPTVADLAEWLFLSPERLAYLADPAGRYEAHGETAINHYHYVFQPKADGSKRLIEAPKEGLKAVQRQILRGIIERLPDHDDAFGFVKGRNCLGGANRHVGEAVVVSFDLKDFFPSIGAGRIYGMFRVLGYPHEVARLLTGLCMTKTPSRILSRLGPASRDHYGRPHLPQGAPSSPALANKVAFGLDRRLAGLARRLGAQYSRYADDMTFSGDAGIAAVLLGAVPEIVRDEGFYINAPKTRVMPMRGRQVVTGVVVNTHLNVPRQAFDRLKAVIHACGKTGDDRLTDPQFRAALEGQIAWVMTVNPQRGTRLRELYDQALGVL